MSRIVNLFVVYQIIRRLTTPFSDWDAFKLGIIDEKGNILRKSKDFLKQDEHNSFQPLDVMVLKLKRLLEKIPGGSSKLATYAAALWLIKEQNIEYNMDQLIEFNEDEFRNYILENAPTNSVGGNAIAGTGENPPVIKSKKMIKRKKLKGKKEEE